MSSTTPSSGDVIGARHEVVNRGHERDPQDQGYDDLDVVLLIEPLDVLHPDLIGVDHPPERRNQPGRAGGLSGSGAP